MSSRECHVCETHARVQALIERSSLGSEEAKAVRESVPSEVGAAIASAARHMARADRAEAALERVRALLTSYREAACVTDGAPCSWHRVAIEIAAELDEAMRGGA